jgi:hypothetical protein
MNSRERLSIFARRKRHLRDKRNVASPRRESRAANSRNYNDWPAGVAPSKISSEWMTANSEVGVTQITVGEESATIHPLTERASILEGIAIPAGETAV